MSGCTSSASAATRCSRASPSPSRWAVRLCRGAYLGLRRLTCRFSPATKKDFDDTVAIHPTSAEGASFLISSTQCLFKLTQVPPHRGRHDAVDRRKRLAEELHSSSSHLSEPARLEVMCAVLPLCWSRDRALEAWTARTDATQPSFASKLTSTATVVVCKRSDESHAEHTGKMAMLRVIQW